MDHFARLGLPAALDLDAGTLDKAYFAQQRLWHPDRFVAKPPRSAPGPRAEAAAVNDAYRTLKDPLARAVYLAGLKGVEMPADGKTIDDPELLMEAMEAREELHEASTIQAIDGLAANVTRRDEILASAGCPACSWQTTEPAIRKALLRLRYLDKFAEEARARRANLERKA